MIDEYDFKLIRTKRHVDLSISHTYDLQTIRREINLNEMPKFRYVLYNVLVV